MSQAQDLPGSNDAVKNVLFQTDEHFRQLVTEHHSLDERIRRFSALTYLTEQQHYEETQLKKQKLVLKDRIEAIVRSHLNGAAAGF